jgi:hypothetical protein
MSLTVPEPFVPALRDLMRLSHEDRAALLSALAEFPPFGQTKDLAAIVRSVLPDLDEGQAELLAGALLSLAYQTKRWSPEELAPRIAESRSLDLPEEQRAELAEFVAALTALEGLTSTAKALDLVLDHEHVFREARIITDIRPIFGGAVEDEPAGAAIISTLSLEHYNTSGDDGKFQVALDEHDLRQLRDRADRALTKTETLKELLASAGLAYFELEEEE